MDGVGGPATGHQEEDATGEPRSRAALVGGDEPFRLISEPATEYLFGLVVDGSGGPKVEWASESFERDYGSTPVQTNEAGGPFAFVHPDDLMDAVELFQGILRGEEVSGRLRAIRKGAVRWVSAFARPLPRNDGEPLRIVGGFHDVTAAVEAAEHIRERAELAELTSEIAFAISERYTVAGALERCAEAIQRHLRAAFTRIWTVDAAGKMLELQASEGTDERVDGEHSRIPVGSLKIGRIALTRRPHLTNDVPDDPDIGDPEWARREGIEAFAGYPLVVEDRLVGVLAVFARHRLNEAVLEAMSAIGTAIAVGIERARAEERLSRSLDDLERVDNERKLLLARLEIAQEQERRRIALELHDGLGQELTTIALFIADMLEDAPPDRRPRHEKLRELVERAQASARRLIWTLRPREIDDLGLAVAVEVLCGQLEEERGLRIECHVALDRRPPSEIESATYRIVQEALTNVVRHAAVKEASVVISVIDSVLTAVIEDEGRGFDPGALDEGAEGRLKMGLLGMRERARLVGGRLTIESRPGAGTTVRLEVAL